MHALCLKTPCGCICVAYEALVPNPCNIDIAAINKAPCPLSKGGCAALVCKIACHITQHRHHHGVDSTLSTTHPSTMPGLQYSKINPRIMDNKTLLFWELALVPLTALLTTASQQGEVVFTLHLDLGHWICYITQYCFLPYALSQYHIAAACSCHSKPPNQPVVSNSDAALTRKVDFLELLFLPLLYMTIQPCVKPLFLSGTRIRQKACFFLCFRNVRLKLRLRGSLGIFYTNSRQRLCVD